MNLADVIKLMPDSAVGVQWLSDCAVSFKEKKRPSLHCEVTFATDAIDPSFGVMKHEKICAIVWLDRKEFSEAVKKIKEEK